MSELKSLKVTIEVNGEQPLHEFKFFEDYLNYEPEEGRPKRYYLVPDIIRSEVMNKIREVTGDTSDQFNSALKEEPHYKNTNSDA